MCLLLLLLLLLKYYLGSGQLQVLLVRLLVLVGGNSGDGTCCR